MDVLGAKAQLRFLNKKASNPIAKLLDSAIANAKNNFSIEDSNLYIASVIVNAGSVLKRWTPRAFGRTSPIMKRTSHIIIVLEEKVSTAKKKIKKIGSGEKETKRVADSAIAKEEIDEGFLGPEKSLPTKERKEKRPYDSSTASKKRFFSRQTFGNIKKNFRRKSI
jgi:large subunit ribosomal protein L22